MTSTPMPTRMRTTARSRFMLPFCFSGGGTVEVAAVSGAAAAVVSVAVVAADVVVSVADAAVVVVGGCVETTAAVVVVTTGAGVGMVCVAATFTGGGVTGFGFGTGVDSMCGGFGLGTTCAVFAEVLRAVWCGFGAALASVVFGAGFAFVTCAGFVFEGGAAAVVVRCGQASGCAPCATRAGVETPRWDRRRPDSRARKRRVSRLG